MAPMISKVVTILAFPLIVFLGGAWLMSALSNREDAVLQPIEKSALLDYEKTPLNQRFGYDLNAVASYWGALDSVGLNAERIFLELDLVFPFFYGAALVISLILAWAMLQRPFNPSWIIAPVCIAAMADWSENLLQLYQLNLYQHDRSALQANLLRIASAATCTKLIGLGVTIMLLAGMIAVVLSRARQA